MHIESDHDSERRVPNGAFHNPQPESAAAASLFATIRKRERRS